MHILTVNLHVRSKHVHNTQSTKTISNYYVQLKRKLLIESYSFHTASFTATEEGELLLRVLQQLWCNRFVLWKSNEEEKRWLLIYRAYLFANKRMVSSRSCLFWLTLLTSSSPVDGQGEQVYCAKTDDTVFSSLVATYLWSSTYV